MLNLLNKSTIDQSNNIRDQFIANKPFKHVVIENFFQKDFCQNLLDEFPSFDKKLAMNENGEVGRKAVNEKISDLGGSYRKLDDLVKGKEFLTLVEKITGINNLHYDPYYFGGGTHNNLDGQDLDPHVDFTHHPISGRCRRLNLIVYLNKEWEKQWGGNIELHKNPRLEPQFDDIISVEPMFNRAVIFETNNISWHGFPRINLPEDKQHLSRKSFALYFYTNTRSEAVKPHSTIYVERHLPEKITTGTTLSAEDLQAIKNLLARRDQHLERLYGYISHMTEETTGLKRQLLQAKDNHKTEVVNNIPDPQTVIGRNSNEPQLIERIYDLENSTSWKITAPMRKIARFFRK